MRFRDRLRWRLTLSHLVAILATLLLMALAIVAIGGAWSGRWRGAETELVGDAQSVARAVGGMVRQGADPTELEPVLRAIVDGRLRVVGAPAGFAPPQARWAEEMAPDLGALEYAVVLRPDGSVLASSALPGSTVTSAHSDAWRTLVERARAVPPPSGRFGRAGEAGATLQGPDGTRLAATPLLDEAGGVAAVVVVGAPAGTAAHVGGPPALVRGLAFFGAASVALLALAFVFAAVPAAGLGYLLSRRLVGRIERLGEAVRALADGDLSRRVEPGPADEVGQLARTFNAMAERLGASVAELETSRARAEGLLAARRELVASVSHELRTPVATARGYLESALRSDGALPDELRGDLETVRREVERLGRLIEELFALSRAEVGKLELRIEPTDVAALVRRQVETAAALAWRGRKVEVLAELPADLAPGLADAERLEQVLSNLLSNAVRHTPPGGLVVAAAQAEDGWVRVEVRDTGDGIPPGELPRVFERFYRGTGEAGDGAGLGLALVKELTEAMGGSVEAESTPGQGSRFAVRVPRA